MVEGIIFSELEYFPFIEKAPPKDLFASSTLKFLSLPLGERYEEDNAKGGAERSSEISAANLRCTVASLELLQELSRTARPSVTWKTVFQIKYKNWSKYLLNWLKIWLYVDCPKTRKDFTIQLGMKLCLVFFSVLEAAQPFRIGSWWGAVVLQALIQGIMCKNVRVDLNCPCVW